MRKTSLFLCAAVVAWQVPVFAGAVDDALTGYEQQGAAGFDAKAGETMWTKTFTHDGADRPRSCASCHTEDPRSTGKHAKTGKAIEPMAPSVNSERLADLKKIEKWFKRNCNWTVGRECTPQEKGDFLAYLRGQ